LNPTATRRVMSSPASSSFLPYADFFHDDAMLSNGCQKLRRGPLDLSVTGR